MKKWLSMFLALCMVFSLTACGGSGSTPDSSETQPVDPASVEVELSEPITITFWHGIVQENMQQTLNEIVDDFNNGIGAEMGITVESYAKGEMSDLENAVTAAIKAGNMPNVTMTEAASVVDWLQAGCVVDLTPYIENANYGLDLDDYYDIYIEDSCSYPVEGYYSLPLYVACEVMYYNVDFFKENNLHKLCGTKPSDFQLTSLRCRGVAKNAARSLCVLNETLYYLSPDGVMAWDGSIPTKVSAVLDASRLANVQSAVGGALDGRYYLHISRTAGTQGQTRLLVYDTERGLWHEEDVCSCDMASTGGQLYLWDGQALWAADPSRESDWQSTEGVEQQVSFELVTGDIGQDGAEQRYLSRLTLRLDAACASTVEVALSYDGGPWETVASLTAREARRSYDLPLVPRRHSTLRLRLRGKGQITLRSLAKNLAAAKGGLVEEQEEATWQV